MVTAFGILFSLVVVIGLTSIIISLFFEKDHVVISPPRKQDYHDDAEVLFNDDFDSTI